MQGLHLTADLYQCAGDTAYMLCADTLAALCRTQVHASGLTLVDDWHAFGQQNSVSGTVLFDIRHDDSRIRKFIFHIRRNIPNCDPCRTDK